MSRRDYDRGPGDVEYVRDYRTHSPPPPARREPIDPYRRPEASYREPDVASPKQYAPSAAGGGPPPPPPGAYYNPTSPRHSQPTFSAAPPHPPTASRTPEAGQYYRPPSPDGRGRRAASPDTQSAYGQRARSRPPSPEPPGGYGQRARSRPPSPEPPGGYGQRARSRPPSPEPPGGYGQRARSRPPSPGDKYGQRARSRPRSPGGAYGQRARSRPPSPGVPHGVRFVEPESVKGDDDRGRPPSPGHRYAPPPASVNGPPGRDVPPAGMTVSEREAWDRVYDRELAEAREMAREREMRGRDVGGARDIGGRDIGGRDIGARDIGARDVGGRDIGGRDQGATHAGGPQDRGFSAEFKTPGGGAASVAYSGKNDNRSRSRHRKDERESMLAWSDSDSDSDAGPPRQYSRPARYETRPPVAPRPDPRADMRPEPLSHSRVEPRPDPRRADPRNSSSHISSPPVDSRQSSTTLTDSRISSSTLADPRASASALPDPRSSTALVPASYSDHKDEPRRNPEPTVRYIHEEPKRYVTNHTTVEHINRPPSPPLPPPAGDRRGSIHYASEDPYYGGGHRREASASFRHGEDPYYAQDDPYYDDHPRGSSPAFRHASTGAIASELARVDLHDRDRRAVAMPYPISPSMPPLRDPYRDPYHDSYHDHRDSYHDHHDSYHRDSFRDSYNDLSPLPSPTFAPRDRDMHFKYDVAGSFSLGSPASAPPGAWPSDNLGPIKSEKPKQRKEDQYDPTEHAETLYKALKGRSVDSIALIKVLPFLTGYQMITLKAEYKKIHPEKFSLTKHIKAGLTGRFQLAAYVAACGPWEAECYWSRLSGQKAQFKYDLLVEALMGRTNDEILDIRDSYVDKKNKHDIIAALEKELASDKAAGPKFTEMILLQLSAKRMEEWDSVYMEKVRDDVEFLNKTLSKDKADVSFLIEFVVLRNDTHLREAMKLYKKEYNKDLARAILNKCPTMVGDALLHILNGVLNRPARDARLLEESMKGVGTRDELLVARLTRIHWDAEHMQAVKESYKEKYKMTLKERIVGDTSGEYQAFLVAMTTVGSGAAAVVVKKS